MWKPPADQVVSDNGWKPPANAVVSDVQQSPPEQQNNFSPGQVALQAAKSAITAPYDATKAMLENPDETRKQLPVAGAVAGSLLGGPLGGAVGAGLGQIGSRMAGIALGTEQYKGNPNFEPKEAIGPMAQTLVAGFPGTTEGQALKQTIGKGLSKVASSFSGAKASDLERAAAKGYSTYSAPSMKEASANFGNALEKSGINTQPTLESTLDPQLSQARQTALDAGQKLSTSELPVVNPNSKVGDPHAIYAYNDSFGPDGSNRAVYNLYGDPQHPVMQQKGWGSSLPKDELDKLGVPITGRQPNAPILSAEEALKGRQAVDRIIAGTPQKDKPTLLALSQLRDRFNSVLANLSPETATASKGYADAILKNNLTKVMPVNKSGEYSKLAPYLAAAAGSTVGFGRHDTGQGALAGGAYLLGTSPLAMGAVASTLGAISPEVRTAALAAFIDKVTTKDNQGGQ